MKIYFLEAFFLILLCLHQTIKTLFSVALAQETRTTGWPAWPPDLPFFNFEGLRASWHSTSTYQNVVGMKITNFEECFFFSYWIAQSRVDFQTRVRFPNKFWLSFIVRYTDFLPWWLRWLRICLQCGRLGFIPGLGRGPGEGNGNPLWYSCLENSMDRGDWWATVHGVTESQTRLSN